MPLRSLSEPRWHPCRSAPARLTRGPLRTWLLDRGSLTARLVALSRGQFEVQVLCQKTGRPRPSEQRALGMGVRQWAWIREVILLGREKPWVYARSVIPLSTLTGRQRSLRRLDKRPLGALLFNDPGMVRGPIELASQNTRSTPLPGPLQQLQADIPGRRSLFWLDGKPLLVCEMFLPEFTPYNTAL